MFIFIKYTYLAKKRSKIKNDLNSNRNRHNLFNVFLSTRLNCLAGDCYRKFTVLISMILDRSSIDRSV